MSRKLCVTFAEKKHVLIMNRWLTDYNLARRGDWMYVARNRDRFRRRILSMESIISPILDSAHRDKIYRRCQQRDNNVIVIDVQGFGNSPDDFIPKELSISDGKKAVHFVFKPSIPFKKLSPTMKKEIRWLEDNHFHIKYCEGHVSLNEVASILRRFSDSSSVIYVKGHQKARFLKTYLNNEIVNIEHVSSNNTPPNLIKTNSACFYHRNTLSCCTVHNVNVLYDFLMN